MAPYLFIFAFVFMLLPIFIGKLSLLRDVLSTSFFRPLSRVSFSAALLEGFGLCLSYFNQKTHIKFDHKNILFLFFALVILIYCAAFVFALFVEYPFRTMAKVFFAPPPKILKLADDLAKELTIDMDNIFNDIDD